MSIKPELRILNYLRDNGKKTQKEIIDETNISARVVRYSLRKLGDKGIIIVTPNLYEMRSVYYSVAEL